MLPWYVVTALCATILAGPRGGFSFPLEERSASQGWSLQASTCPSGTTSCGDGAACCPSSMTCHAANNDEVASCCSGSSACVGSIEGSPSCADNAWSLWQGLQGNDFCCQVGLVGIFSYSGNRAGTCVPSTAVSTATSAITATIRSTGTGTAVTTTSSTTTTTSTTTTSTSSKSSGTATATNKPVFAHYMVGTITDAHCQQDISDAQALGIDALILNTATVTESWATTTIASLFKWAATYNFKLFFSFDMTGFSDPSQFTSFLLSYVNNSAHYTYDGLPMVTTFNGGASSYTFGEDSVNDGWKIKFQEVMSDAGHPVYFVPAFQDAPNGAANFFTIYPTVDGAMNWNAWPQNTQGDIVVPTADDQTYLAGARAAGKTFMMGVSPLQFKHIDSSQNWYRRGEENLEYRFGQVLNLQPDFIELLTWNDAGESHYMGNSWPEPISGTAIPGYTDDYDHTGYWQILPSFIKAWKAGATDTSTMYPTNSATAQGVFWHHTLLANGTCPSDPLGPPQGVDTVQDLVTGVVLVKQGQTGLKVTVTSGSTTLGTQSLSAGYNSFSFGGLTTGTVVVTVTNSSGSKVVSGTGPIAVVSTADLCNYNFQVVALS